MNQLHFTIVQIDHEIFASIWYLALNGEPVLTVNFGGGETAKRRAQAAADELNQRISFDVEGRGNR